MSAGKRITPTGELVLPASAPRWQWLEARRQGITGTDVVKIIGASRYGGPLDVYLDKRVGEDDRDNEPARWGRLLEDDVAREWARRHGEGTRIRRAGLVRHHRHRHHMVTCDRLVVGQAAVLECKTTSAFKADDWAEGIPQHVTIQTQWQMHVTGYNVAHIAALIGGQRLASFAVERDQPVIDYLVEEADRLWECVQAGTPPKVHPGLLTDEALDRLHPDRAGVVHIDPDEAGAWIDRYRAAQAAEKAAEGAKAEARLALLQMLGDGDVAAIGDRVAFTYTAGKPSVSVPAANARTLLNDHPELAADYVVTKPPTRTFALKK